MNQLFNPIGTKSRRRRLRRRQTPAERQLWAELRNHQLDGHKFFRQYGVGGYILDFYAPRLHLCIELDGPYHLHPDQRLLDDARTNYLRGLGIRVLRFDNERVFDDLPAVLEAIRCAISGSVATDLVGSGMSCTLAAIPATLPLPNHIVDPAPPV